MKNSKIPVFIRFGGAVQFSHFVGEIQFKPSAEELKAAQRALQGLPEHLRSAQGSVPRRFRRPSAN